MKVTIRKENSQVMTGNLPGKINTYTVIEDGKEFSLTRTSHALGSSIGISGKKGILYVDSDDNKVHWQVAAPSGACGLYTDDEVIEGISPLTLRAVLLADQCDGEDEITIIPYFRHSG
ncbi:MAG: hypothetical protein ACYDHW_15205 [Syntrophorhabdaceae bacterium]